MTACNLHPEQPRPCAPCGVARFRAAMASAPRTPRDTEPEPDTTHARALARARHERTTR